jgi:hypothetical protein
MITIRKIQDNRFAIALVPIILCLFLAPPHNFSDNFTIVSSTKDFHYYDFLLEQIREIRHMGFPESAHENKMEVRILIPLLLRYIYVFDQQYLPVFIYVINLICLYLFSLQLIRFQQQRLPNLRPLWLTPLLFTTIYTGITFVIDFWPNFDGIAFLLVAIAMNTRSFPVKTVLLLSALFVDERSIFGAAMIFLVDLEHDHRKSIAYGLALIFTYMLIRTLLTNFYGLNSIFKRSSDLIFFKYIHKDNFSFFTMAVVNCFKGLWLLPLFLCWNWIRELSFSARLSYAGLAVIFIGILLGSLLVADFTRSFSYGYPFFLYTLYYLHKVNHNMISTKMMLQVIIFTNILTVTYFFHSENEIYSTTDIITKIGISLLK